jgi:hypothetical protein
MVGKTDSNVFHLMTYKLQTLSLVLNEVPCLLSCMLARTSLKVLAISLELHTYV